MPNDYNTKIKAARDAGYSNDEIAQFLSKSDAKMASALSAGYSGDEIIGHLEPSLRGQNIPPSAAENLRRSTKETEFEKQNNPKWYERAPLEFLGGLGQSAGVPETATPFADMGRGLLETGKEIATDPSAKYGLPIIPIAKTAYKMGKAVVGSAVQGGKDIYGGVSEGDFNRASHGAGELLGSGLAITSVGKPAVSATRSGATSARAAVAEKAMESPNVAAQRAIVSPKSKQAAQAQRNIEGARPFLNEPKNLAELQKNIPVAKAEIWEPYQKAVDSIADKVVEGPDGPVSIAALENLRQKTSAELRSLKEMRPTERQAVLQKEGAIAELVEREKKIIAALDPELTSQGIDPKLIRKTFGNVKGIETAVQGRNTLTEGQPSGIGRMMEIGLMSPKTWLGKPLAGARDIAAGRGWWEKKPTDVFVREGFRSPGAKPTLTIPLAPTAQGPQIRGMLGTGPIVTPSPFGANAPVNVPGAIPPTFTATSRAQRMGLLLPKKASGVAPKITLSTDSLGIKWAETPDGVRVSIPKRIPEAEVMGYAKQKLAEQRTGQGGIKFSDVRKQGRGN